MCRSLKNGQRRRCPSCTSYPAAARANGNRRQGRLARRKVVDHLERIGLTETAAAVLASPPSVLASFMAATDIDPAVLGEVPMPGAGPNGVDVTALVEKATSERAQRKRVVSVAAAARPTTAVTAPPRVPAAGPAPTSVHAGAAARLAAALGRRRAVRPGAPAPAANVPNCKKNISVVMEWEDRAEHVFAAGASKAQCRIACAEAEMLCKGCPLMESCAQEAKVTHYTGVAGGRIFVNGRHRLTPSAPARIVA
ncbi:hypothetical protein [Mycolicibacterium palauense]|uniref:hypothetical protein n=1 Tax=Mycolicibacterium palauense TaxID=2034511 RepID=UPI000BFF0C89|nr:hypothetical protein [Mycolicibacterium palauense]